jgi:hypothetical protein
LANEKGFKESGSMIPEIPIQAIWANPPTPDIVKRINREDLFSYETICLEDNLDGIKPLNKNLKHFKNQPTAMAEAFAECIGNKKFPCSCSVPVIRSSLTKFSKQIAPDPCRGVGPENSGHKIMGNVYGWIRFFGPDENKFPGIALYRIRLCCAGQSCRRPVKGNLI